MVWIVVNPRQRIAEYSESRLERYAVLPEVRGSLRRVPRESRSNQGQAYHLPLAASPLVGLTPAVGYAGVRLALEHRTSA